MGDFRRSHGAAVNVFLHTLGCKANQADTERVRQAFEDAGAVIVSDPVEADVAIVNSCTVTHVAEAKLRGIVRRVARRRPEIDTVVMGCAAALDDGSLATLPTVRAVVGGGDPALVLRAAGLTGARADPILRRFDRGARAWLKVQDGCDEHCTFCATTHARGANRSRPVAEVVAEARALARHHAELVITGVHIGSYGVDLHGGWSLSRLVAELLDQVPSVRYRLSSLEATEVDDRLATLYVSSGGALAPHLHAPLQSGSDRVLHRMGRHWYSARTYCERVERLASRLGAFGLGADVMVGFPGEELDDHAATVAVIERLPFTYLHVFPYSPRPDAAAVRLGRPISSRTQSIRAAELRAVGERKSQAYRASRGGQVADGVATGRLNGAVQFITGDYLTVSIPVDEWDGGGRRSVFIN